MSRIGNYRISLNCNLSSSCNISLSATMPPPLTVIDRRTFKLQRLTGMTKIASQGPGPTPSSSEHMCDPIHFRATRSTAKFIILVEKS
jgi:hypothetical protein